MLSLRVRLFCLLLFSAISYRLIAQDQRTGIYPWGSYDTRGFDTVNLGNLNVHFEIPIVSKTGRGLGFDYRLVYDSLFYTTTSTVFASSTWVADPGYGFRGQLGGETASYTGYTTYQTLPKLNCPMVGSRKVNGSIQNNYIYHDRFGQNHRLNVSYSFCPLTDVDPIVSGNGKSSDGSGIYWGIADALVHLSDGEVINAPTVSGGTVYSGTITDTNANKISNNGDGTFTDTTGTTALTISGAGTPSSPKTFTYKVAAQSDSSTTATIVVSYLTYSVATAFTCPGTSQFPTQSISLIDKVTYPDNTFYKFDYESTPGVSGAVTGRLAKITLPTGGTIQYQYSGGCSGGINTDGTSATLTRIASGTKTYTRAITSATASTTSVQDEVGNQSAYTFQTFNNLSYQSRQQTYQGAASGTPLLDVQTCYNGAAPDCTNTPVTVAITSVDTYETYDGSKQKGTKSLYNSSGLLTEQDDYDFGSSTSRGSLLRQVTNTYQDTGNGTVITLANVVDGGSHLLSKTAYSYDETTGAGHAGLQPTSGLPGRGSLSGARNNLTSLKQFVSTIANYASTAFAYDDAGQVRSSLDPRGYSTIYSYDSTGTFLSSTSYPTPSSGVAIHTSSSFDTASGIILSTTDPNGKTTNYSSYDKRLRPLEIDVPDTGKTYYSYPSATHVDTTVLATPNPSIVSSDDVDAYGRPYRHQVGSVGSETTYNVVGQLYCSTNPHLSISSITDGQDCISLYDALGRPKTLTHSDSSSRTWSYSANTATATDEAASSTHSTSDGLGRLTQVTESGGLVTTYTYTGDLSGGATLTVNQNGKAGDTARPVRSFKSDTRGLVLSKTTPESGTITYSYDLNGNLSTFTDARTKIRTYQYDSLNRLTQKSFNDSTPAEVYAYDAVNASYPSSTNLIGRLSSSYSLNRQAKFYSYDAVGRINALAYSLPSDQGTSNLEQFIAHYDLAGNMMDIYYPDGRHLNQAYDALGHLTSVVYADWQNATYPRWTGNPYVSNISYDPLGGVTSQMYGNGVVETFNRNNRLRLVGQKLTSGSANLQQKTLCWGSASTPGCSVGFGADSGNLQQINDALATTKTQNFTYDDKHRLTGFSTMSNAIQQTYTVDSFGNMGQSGFLGGPACCNSNNRITETGYGYDSAGNLTQLKVPGTGATQTMGYDAESQLVNFNSITTYVYDADGEMLRSASGSNWKEYLRFGGQVLEEKNSDGTWSDYVFANGQRIAKADTFDNVIELKGTSTASSGNASFILSGDAGMSGYTIKTGDKLFLRQYVAGPAKGSIEISMQDGTSLSGLTDQDGNPVDQDPPVNDWHVRKLDLSSKAGKVVSHIYMGATFTGAGAWTSSFADAVIDSTDGSVYPIYTGQASTSLSVSSSSNSVSLSSHVAKYSTIANVYYYTPSQVGSTRMMLSPGKWPSSNSPNCCSAMQGWPIEQEDYLPYGQRYYKRPGDNNAFPTTAENQYLYTGLKRDGDSGFDLATFRQYASVQGRWTTPDPYDGSYDLSDPQSLNRYSYVANNPVANADPTGEVDCNTFNGTYEGSGSGFPCESDSSQHYGGPAEAPTAIAGGPGVATGSMIGYQSPYFAESLGSYLGYVRSATGWVAGDDPLAILAAINNCAQTPSGTPSKYCDPLQMGLDAAKKALNQKSCGAFYGGQGGQTLNATTYRFLDLHNPTTGAATVDPKNVFINSAGPYMNFKPTTGQAGPFGRYWTQSQFRGFILLHELGHQLSPITDFRPDAGSPLNQTQSGWVLSHCF